MRSACVPVIAGLLLGCTPNASTQPPDQTSEAAPEPAAAADEPVEGDSPQEAGAAEAGAPAPEPTPAEGGASTVVANDGEPASDGGTGPAPAAKPEPSAPVVATLELPKPLHGKLDAACGKDPGVGERLKSFSLPGIEGKDPVTPGTFRGRVLVVNFWGTWCKPCLEELPEFDQLYRRYRKHGMTLLAIATDEDAQAVKDMVTKRKLGAKIAIAGEAYAGQYGSAKFPFTFVVDHKGVIQASYRGYKPECLGQLEADIREQLEARADAKAQRNKKG